MSVILLFTIVIITPAAVFGPIRSTILIIHSFISISLSHSIVTLILFTILNGVASFLRQDIGHVELNFLS